MQFFKYIYSSKLGTKFQFSIKFYSQHFIAVIFAFPQFLFRDVYRCAEFSLVRVQKIVPRVVEKLMAAILRNAGGKKRRV